MEGHGDRPVVLQDDEMTCVQHVPEVLPCFVNYHELPVVGTTFLQCRSQLPGEVNWLQCVLDALLEEAPMAEFEASVT